MDRRTFIGTLAGALVGASLAEAQPTKVYRIGYLSPGAPPQADGDWSAQGLRELGCVEVAPSSAATSDRNHERNPNRDDRCRIGSTALSLWDLEPETTMGVLGRSPPRF